MSCSRFRSGRGCDLSVCSQDQRRATPGAARHRPRLGWQRSLAARCRRHTLLCFPAALCLEFSGFYLPLTIVLWLLILRGIGIEFRAHIENRMWQDFFDVVFSGSSLLLAVFFGAALGNVVRGVPLDSTAISLNRSGRISNSVRDRHPRLVYRTHRRAGAW